MIKLTYKVVCDLCKKECVTQEFDCMNHPHWEFPRPTRAFSYELQGAMELCNDCATPLVQAKQEAVAQALKEQGHVQPWTGTPK